MFCQQERQVGLSLASTDKQLNFILVHQDDRLKEEDFFQVSKLFSVRDLLNVNVHLGHHEGCWNPHMKPYLYGSRERFHIIDLDKTASYLKV